MKAVILAGGYGTRLSEETEVRPKPMVEIGGKPILWHIMKAFSHYGHNEFVILLGYKGYLVKEYFANYFLHQSDVTVDLANNSISTHTRPSESWTVTLLDTGLDTMTGGRILRAAPYVGDETFLLTYGDGVADVDLEALTAFHGRHGRTATLTTVQPEGRYGSVDSEEGGRITLFREKPPGDSAWVNGGFFVCEPKVFDYIREGDSTVFEGAPLEEMAREKELYAYRHGGFWKCMDTLRDKVQLNRMWEENKAAWKIWE